MSEQSTLNSLPNNGRGGVGPSYDPMVNHPKHYNSHPSGIECIDIIRYYDFNIGSAMKYLWRQGLKGEAGMTQNAKAIQDLKKAIFYIEDEIKQLEKE